MKKNIFILTLLAVIGCTASKEVSLTKHLWPKKYREHFTIKDCTVYYNGNPIAKYQAKTFSLDGGELVEEYNLLLLDNQIKEKQIIGDLIDYISDRHQGAEVEVEVDSNGSVFKL